MKSYIIDTHTFVWFLTGSKQLSRRAENILKDSKAQLIIPTIILAEIKYLIHKRKMPLSFEKIKTAIDEDERCVIFPLNEDVVDYLPTELDIHDGIICATALVLQKALSEEVAIITKDEEIRKSELVEVLW